jgi:hypothetical protein
MQRKPDISLAQEQLGWASKVPLCSDKIIGQGHEPRRPISLLVHVAFHFAPHRWQYLERVLAGLAEFEIDRILVVVDSNTNDVSDRLAALSLPGHCNVRVDVHANLSHPFDLTWAHRRHMASALESFNYFMYLEDDVYIPWQTFDAWLRRSESVCKRGFIHGFLRVEFDLAGHPVSTDWCSSAKRPPAIEIDGVKYIRPKWFYHACWVYSRRTMRRFVRSESWTRGSHRWSSATRTFDRNNKGVTRELSAFGMACAAPGRPRILLPVNDSGQIPSDAWVYHLPNNYAQGSPNNYGFGSIDARHLVEGGLGRSQPFDLIGRAVEARKWTAYYVNGRTIRVLRKSIATAVKWSIARAGFELRRLPTQSNDPPPQSNNPPPQFLDEPQWIREIVDKVSPFTMTSIERIISLCHAVQYVSQSGIGGDVVECGVWRGGSMMAAALTFAHLGDTKRSLYLFDTFEGMTPPTDADRNIGSGRLASDILAKDPKTGHVWAISPIDEVRANLQKTGYPDDRLHFVKGRVEDTIPANAPDQISVLRLDTDWYESTHHELSHLYPRLSEHGVLIIDDYGWWEGARKAVDEYVEAKKLPLLLQRIDKLGGRIAIKITR